MENNLVSTSIVSAIEQGELQAYYQPKYDATTSRLKSAEALVRWIKQDGTMVLPGLFLPELEKSEAILTVDWFILEDVCAFFAQAVR